MTYSRAAPRRRAVADWPRSTSRPNSRRSAWRDRKSTRLNSSHGYISYAVFCLKKKKNSELEDRFYQLYALTGVSSTSSSLLPHDVATRPSLLAHASHDLRTSSHTFQKHHRYHD